MNKSDPWAKGGQIDRQNGEFDAVDAVANAYRNLPAVVDDDYPEARHRYESAMQALLAALHVNRPRAFARSAALRIKRPSSPAPAVKNFNAAVLANLHIEVNAELGRASVWPPMNSAHEGYGVLLEEMDELFAHVKTKQKKRDLIAMRAEAVQVAAMALRFAHDVCSEERGRK